MKLRLHCRPGPGPGAFVRVCGDFSTRSSSGGATPEQGPGHTLLAS
jgi:hypothetical protein